MAIIPFTSQTNNSRKSSTYVDESKFIYSDLDLEFLDNVNVDDVKLKDIKILKDTRCIANSIRTLFSTNKGELHLIPQYGLNLAPYLFKSLSESNAKLIGNEIFNGIKKWEPRVKIENIAVSINEDLLQYEISLKFYIPLISKTDMFGFSYNLSINNL